MTERPEDPVTKPNLHPEEPEDPKEPAVPGDDRPDGEEEPPEEGGPELDPGLADDDELENEPVHVDDQVPTDPPGDV